MSVNFKQKRIINQIRAAALNFLFPSKCILCSAFINSEDNRYDILTKPIPDSKNLVNLFEKIIKLYVCKDCIEELKPVRPPICPVCGEMFQSMADDNHLCKRCIKTDRNFTKARAGGVYTGILKSLIHQLKYGEKITAAKPLSVFLFYSYLKFFKEKDFDYITPLPLHIKKAKKRGFNQSYFLVKYWGKIAKNFKIKIPEIRLNIIEKQKNTPSQAGLSANKREKNIKNSFAVKDANKVCGKSFLIIDDVVTTGATVEECAKVLKRAGAVRVEVLSLARSIL